MASTTTEFLDSLRRQVDELATATVLADGPAETAQICESLVAIRKAALAAGQGDAAAVAGELVAGLTAGDGAPALPLDEGIARLQQAISEAGTVPEPAVNPLAEDPELLGDFVVESREHLRNIEGKLLEIETDVHDAEALNSVFRSFHTIKGLAGFLDLTAIREVAHEVETLLDRARNGELRVTPPVVDVVLKSADYLEQATQGIESRLKGKPWPAQPCQGLIDQVRRAAELAASAGSVEEVSAPAEAQAQPEDAAAETEPATEAAARRPQELVAIRVETTKLDHLLDMVGELVIAQAMVRHDPALQTTTSPRLQGHLSQLARITDEVQKTTMTLRMVQIGQLFQRMKRLVRDLSRKAGKSVELEVSGEDTELDKTVVDGLADPLMHMVRNALDHGIETTAERAAAGKIPTARVSLRAYHKAGFVVVEVSDDGRGLDREKIARKARDRGLISESESLADPQVYQLIFEPGFSTAEQVTDISGRGVGMDVVRKNIQRMRGRVDIESRPGAGTTFYLRLPLTLAIIDGLVVGVGRERYIVPIFAVSEMFRPTPDMVSTVHGRGEMVLVRGRLLPFIRLHRRFGVEARTEDPCQSLFIVSESAGRPFCLMVDEFLGKQEVVIKSLGECFKNTGGIAGGAILGDGRVGLILEMSEVFRETMHG